MCVIEVSDSILCMVQVRFGFPRIIVRRISFPSDLVEGTAAHDFLVNDVVDEIFLDVVYHFWWWSVRGSLFCSGRRAIGGEEDFIEDGMDTGPSTREAKLKRRWANLFDYRKGAITLL
jgi:hypothetical protein